MGRSIIQDVPDTAFMIAAQRAVESERPDALFRDPLAKKLAGARGAAILAGLPWWSRGLSDWTVAIRTAIIDDLIGAAVAGGIDTILNLGAGLDARPYRMTLPETLCWVEVDYPSILEHKEALLSSERPRCRLDRVKLDLGEVSERRRFLGEIGATSKKALVLTEGVVPYLTLEEAASLADDLRLVDPVQAWIVEYLSPALVRRRQRLGRKQMQKAPWRFDPGDWFAFFAQHGWKAKEVRYLFEEGERRARPIPLPLPLRALLSVRRWFLGPGRLAEMERSAGYVAFEPK